LTTVSIWAGERPSGKVLVDTIGRLLASGGKSHSNVTPTTLSPAPTANKISVVDGSSDTIRMPGKATTGVLGVLALPFTLTIRARECRRPGD
jgi:hypothetical protein